MAVHRGVPTVLVLLLAGPALAACSGGSGRTAPPPVVRLSPVPSGGASPAVVSSPPPSDRSAPSTPPTVTVTAPPATTAAPAPGGPGLCTPTVATLAAGTRQGAAGTAVQEVVVTNASRQPCVTTGYPGVALLDGAGRQVAQATRSGPAGPTIVLQPGEKASAVITASDLVGSGPCPGTSAAVLFTLPDNTDPTRLDIRLPTCGVAVFPLQRVS